MCWCVGDKLFSTIFLGGVILGGDRCDPSWRLWGSRTLVCYRNLFREHHLSH